MNERHTENCLAQQRLGKEGADLEILLTRCGTSIEDDPATRVRRRRRRGLVTAAVVVEFGVPSCPFGRSKCLRPFSPSLSKVPNRTLCVGHPPCRSCLGHGTMAPPGREGGGWALGT